MAKLTPSAMMPPESEFMDLLRRLPLRFRASGWRCPECGAFLRNGRAQVQMCSPCEERGEQEAWDAWEAAREPDPLPLPDRRINEKIVRLFWSKVIRGGENCWLWTGTLCNGTPELASERNTFMARRVSYELHHGPLPRTVRVWAICKNQRCVNPAHLQAGAKA